MARRGQTKILGPIQRRNWGGARERSPPLDGQGGGRRPPPLILAIPIQGEAPSIQASNFEDFNSCRQLSYSFSPQKVQKTMNLPYPPSPL